MEFWHVCWSAKSINIAFRNFLRDIYDIFEEGKQFYNTNDESNYIERFLDYVKIFQLIMQSWKKLTMFMYTQQVLVGQI